MGNFVHDVLEQFYLVPPEDRTQATARIIAAGQWEDKWRELVLPWVRGDEAIRLFRWKAWWCIENLWKIENPEYVAPCAVEHELNGQISGVTIKGFIDRFSPHENGFVISDYKTGKTPKQNWVGNKFTQLLIYSHLLSSTGVGDAQEVELLYLKDGVRFNQRVTEELLKETEEYVISTKEKIDSRCVSEKFEPHKSILCNWCSFRKECPAWK